MGMFSNQSYLYTHKENVPKDLICTIMSLTKKPL